MRNSEVKRINNFLEEKISILYNVAPPPIIKTYLMLNDSDGIGGERGRELDQKSVILEISKVSIKKEKINQCLAILWHEIIQGCYSPFYFLPLLKKFTKTERTAMYIEEINIRSLLPIGIFGIKFFDYKLPLTLTPFPHEKIPKINSTQTIEIINLTHKYILENKKFDKDYIGNLISILKKNKKWITPLKG